MIGILKSTSFVLNSTSHFKNSSEASEKKNGWKEKMKQGHSKKGSSREKNTKRKLSGRNLGYDRLKLKYYHGRGTLEERDYILNVLGQILRESRWNRFKIDYSLF